MVRICTDSSSLLSEGEARRLGVTVVPVHVALDGEPFGGDDDAFYARVGAGARAATAPPSPGELLDAYARAAQAGAAEILSLHLDARLSGTVASAELAAREAPVPVTVVDTATASFGVALCVRETASALRAGASAGEAVALARRLGGSLQSAFAARGAPAGRVGVLSDWSVLRFANAATAQAVACGSPAEAVETMLSEILGTHGPLRAAVGHASHEVASWANALVRALGDEERVVAVERYRVAPPVGAHTGPSAFGAFWWTAGPSR